MLKNMKYKIPVYNEKDKIQIGGFCAPSVRLSGDARRPAQAAFNDAKELGLDFLIPDHFQCDFGDAPEEALVYLNRAYDAGLKVYPYDTGLGCRTSAGHKLRAAAWDTTWAKRYVEHPAFAGLHFFDEPFGQEVEIVAAKQKKWREEFGGKDFLVNLNPGYAPGDLLGYVDKEKTIKADFRYYVENYIELAHPDILSFDHYAIYENGGLRHSYFAETALMGFAAKKGKYKSHFYILSTGHGPYRRIPTVSELRWQIAVGMTFGLKSFTHYTAGAIYDGYDDIISPSLQRTELWYNIQKVNREVNMWSHVYKSFYYEGFLIIHGNHGRPNEMLDLIDKRDGYISQDQIDTLTHIDSSEDVIAGIFVDAAENKGIMLTNANNPNIRSQNPFDRKNAFVTLVFTDDYVVQVYEKGVASFIKTVDKKVTIGLESGEGKFLVIAKQ